MLSSLVQEHNARQAGNKARQERLRQEANKAAGKDVNWIIAFNTEHFWADSVLTWRLWI